MPHAIRGAATQLIPIPLRSLLALLPLLVLLIAGCSTAPEAGTEAARPTPAESGAPARPETAGNDDDAGLFGWLGDLNPFKDESRSAVESGRVVERIDGDGSRRVSIDVDLSRGEGPRSLLCTVTRRTPPNGGADSLDLVTLLVRDDPRRMMLFDESPAILVVARERHALAPLPPNGDSVKRAAEELQARRTFRVPPGLLDRLTSGAPVQLVVVIGGAEVTRTIPGSVCEQIESAGANRSTNAAPSSPVAGDAVARR